MHITEWFNDFYNNQTVLFFPTLFGEDSLDWQEISPLILFPQQDSRGAEEKEKAVSKQEHEGWVKQSSQTKAEKMFLVY